MNKYEKKKNILQTLLEINAVKTIFMVVSVIIAPLLIDLLMLKIPYILNKVALKNTVEYFASMYLIGLAAMGIAYLGYLCILIIARIVKSISISLHAAKIMQYLPLSKEDWERFDAKTDEEAIHILRDLVKTVGYRSDLKKCKELRDKIADSYRAFLLFRYEDTYIVKFNNASSLVVCSDEDFDELLKIAHDEYHPYSIY